MPRLEYFLVCRAVLGDLDTSELCFMHVLEDIFPESFPLVIPKANVVSSWNVEEQEADVDYQVNVVVKVPGRPDVQFPMNVTRGRHRFRAIQGILDIPLAGAGDVVFELLLNSTHKASHTVKVHQPGVRGQEGGLLATLPRPLT